MVKIRVSIVIGELMLIVGVILLFFFFYEVYWINLEFGKLQDKVNEKFDIQWYNFCGKLKFEFGEVFVCMYILIFGFDFYFVILEGMEDEDFLCGFGYYVDIQMLGELGNFGVVGYCVGKGVFFNDLGNFEICDVIVIEI